MSRCHLLIGGPLPGLACVLLGLLPAEGSAQPHLAWATRLVREVGPRTSYRLIQGPVTWRGATPAGVASNGSTIRHASETRCNTDCSGLLDAVLRQAYGLSGQDMRRWLGGTRRPLAVHYHDAIVGQRGFRRILHVQDARPGNIIAIRYARSRPDLGNVTGHALLVVGRPRRTAAAPPLKPGTRQWTVPTIDQARHRHLLGNSRPRHGGIGQGGFRIYAHPTGTVAGYAWDAAPPRRHYFPQDLSNHHLVIGRITSPR